MLILTTLTGIGYFVLPYLVHAKARYVHACEWNDDAVVALRRNLELNKVADRCTVYHGDNAVVCATTVLFCMHMCILSLSFDKCFIFTTIIPRYVRKESPTGSIWGLSQPRVTDGVWFVAQVV